jgi:dipeptidyl aminopeptidase/acylaminoacyl peptidase
MTERRALPHGSWVSPITIDMAVSSATALGGPRFGGDDVYWIEGRPQEGGRQVIVHWDAKTGARDVNPPPFNARTMAHEYGGGSYAVAQNQTVYFSNVADGRIYRQLEGGQPEPLTAAGPYRYGDLVYDPDHDRLLCIREDHAGLDHDAPVAEGARIAEPRDALVAVDVLTGEVKVLHDGIDFYSTPRPGGDRLAWLAWRHPNMPWDASELWVSEVDDSGSLVDPRMVAGGGDESIAQPEWGPEGSLIFVSDRSGWWNLYRWRGDRREAEALLPMEAEFAGPQWVFGMRWYDVDPQGTIVATATRSGRNELWHIPVAGDARRIEVPDPQIASVVTQGVGPQRVAYVAAAPDAPTAVVELSLDGREPVRRVLRESFSLSADPAYLSKPESIEFPTTDGDVAHALYYPPTNPDFRGPDGAKPPLIVEIHGGPTSSAGGGLSMEANVFTSRGFAIVDVDYRGSTGYGRAYMRKLDGKWGVYDVDDCIAAARFLAERGDVDPSRMAIRGGSAGGYTTLAALVFHDVFAAGASHYGVGDLEALARFTHKFESRYMDRLVAPYPEGVDVYHARSPIYHVERLSRPLIVLQGTDDMVVPIAQAEQIVAALRAQRIPHAYLPFEGEGHGFRRAANMKRALEAELSFYAQVFGFELADDIEPVEVEFLNG